MLVDVFAPKRTEPAQIKEIFYDEYGNIDMVRVYDTAPTHNAFTKREPIMEQRMERDEQGNLTRVVEYDLSDPPPGGWAAWPNAKRKPPTYRRVVRDQETGRVVHLEDEPA